MNFSEHLQCFILRCGVLDESILITGQKPRNVFGVGLVYELFVVVGFETRTFILGLLEILKMN